MSDLQTISFLVLAVAPALIAVAILNLRHRRWLKSLTPEERAIYQAADDLEGQIW